MTSFTVASTLAAKYPEENIFALKPGVFGLVPWPDSGQELDTPELRAAALAIAQARNGFNVLAGTYGSNPLFIDDPTIQRASIPMTAYRRPPALRECQLPADTEFAQVLHESLAYRTVLVESKDWDSPRVLKLYLKEHFDDPLDAPRLYIREREAYAHLMHRPIPDGVVQMCFGSVSLSVPQRDRVHQALGDTRLVVSCEALLLEYIPGAVKPNIENTSLDIMHKFLRSLYEIHAAYVLQGSVHTRNMRFVPSADGKTATRVFWTDFTGATCASDPSLRRQDLFLELQACWDYLFVKLMPAQRIGYAPAFDS